VWGLLLWVVPFFAGPLVQRLFEKRTRLISYVLHPSGVLIHPPDANPLQIHFHAIVIKNDGRKPATNVRIGHALLPDHSIFPDVQRSIVDLPGGGKEILFPVLVPTEQITIQYLYFAPLQWQQLNTNIKSDEGPAKILNVLPTPQISKPAKYAFVAVFIVGIIALLYLLLLVITLAAHGHNQTVSATVPAQAKTEGRLPAIPKQNSIFPGLDVSLVQYQNRVGPMHQSHRNTTAHPTTDPWRPAGTIQRWLLKLAQIAS